MRSVLDRRSGHRGRWAARLGLLTSLGALSFICTSNPAWGHDPVETSTASPHETDEPWPWSGHLTVSPLEAFPGATVHVSGECQFHGQAATYAALYFQVDSQDRFYRVILPLDRSTVKIEVDVTVPKEVPPGVAELSWDCFADDQGFAYSPEDIAFTILDPGTTLPTPALPVPPLTEAPPAPTESATAAGPDKELADTGTMAPQTSLAMAALLTLAGVGAAMASGVRAGRPARRRT